MTDFDKSMSGAAAWRTARVAKTISCAAFASLMGVLAQAQIAQPVAGMIERDLSQK
jgi:hypothetical protein